MKIAIIIVLILLSFVLLFSKPIIKFDALEHDFGNIKEDGGPYEYEFIFLNTGDEPLKLIKVKAS